MIVLSTTIPVGVIIIVILFAVLLVLCHKAISRIKKAQIYSPKKGEEGYERKRRKKKNKPE